MNVVSKYNGVALVVLVIFLDQLSKFLVLKFFPTVWILNNKIIFGLVGVEYVNIIAFLGIFSFIFLFRTFIYITGYYLVIGGALSILIDRLSRGGVIDFIPFFDISLVNLADIFIVVGVLQMLYLKAFDKREQC